jgi:hypothetical protein
MSPEARRVLVAAVDFEGRACGGVIPLKRIAMDVLDDADAASRALRELDLSGCVRTDTMGWQGGWVTRRGRALAQRPAA